MGQKDRKKTVSLLLIENARRVGQEKASPTDHFKHRLDTKSRKKGGVEMNVRARTTAKGRVLWLQIRSTLAQKQSNMSTFTRKSLKSNFCILLPHFAHFCIGSLNTPPKNNAQKDRENARKRPKMTPKMGQNGPKRPQNEVKTK